MRERSFGELDAPDMGDLIILLLTSTLAGLRDRLYEDGFDRASDLVADLVDIADDYVCGRPNEKTSTGTSLIHDL